MQPGFSAAASQPPTAPLPALSELKNFLSAELASFKDELSVRTTNPSTSQLRKFVLKIPLATHLNTKGTKSSTSIRKT